MILWIEMVSRDDRDWETLRALLQVIPIEPRKPHRARRRAAIEYWDDASDFLVRPQLKGVLADYFTFNISCGSYVTAIGKIPLNESRQVEEFLDVVGGALQGDLTSALRSKWIAHERAKDLAAHDDGPNGREMAQRLTQQCQDLARHAERNIERARSHLLGSSAVQAVPGKHTVLRNVDVVEILRQMGVEALTEAQESERAIAEVDGASL